MHLDHLVMKFFDVDGLVIDEAHGGGGVFFGLVVAVVCLEAVVKVEGGVFHLLAQLCQAFVIFGLGAALEDAGASALPVELPLRVDLMHCRLGASASGASAVAEYFALFLLS